MTNNDTDEIARPRTQLPKPGGNSSSRFWGIFSRRERWGLSLRGWLFLVCVISATFVVLAMNVHPFLAQTSRVDTNTLVVEGWVHEFGVRVAIEEFRTGKYERVFTTGGPQEGSGAGNNAPTAAEVVADWLHYRGIPADVLQAVPSQEIKWDRTYQSAIALRNWFGEHGVTARSLNVVTETTHARRTRLLYTEAFGDRIAIGIIAADNPEYDPRRWWKYSNGVRDVVGEALAYLYAKLFFHPNRAESASDGDWSQSAARLSAITPAQPAG
ncbi:MAG: hypothetical protein QOG67_3096 [Verrucomicrobiota bacterium]|jgi:uncharacterized SAM-binding protein YcdF (DUF218 family)